MYFEKDNEVIVKCTCGLLEHQFHFTDIDDGLVEVVIIPTTRTFREKLALVWKILRGKETMIYDIVINHKDCKELGDWLKKRGN